MSRLTYGVYVLYWLFRTVFSCSLWMSLNLGTRGGTYEFFEQPKHLRTPSAFPLRYPRTDASFLDIRFLQPSNSG